MAVTHIQDKTVALSTAGTTTTDTFTTVPTAGRVLTACVVNFSSTKNVTGIATGGGSVDVWSNIVSTAIGTGAQGFIELWQVRAGTDARSGAITVTMSATPASGSCVTISEWAGVMTGASNLDGTPQTATGTSATSFSAPAMTPSASGDLVIAIDTTGNGSTTITTSGFANLDTFGTTSGGFAQAAWEVYNSLAALTVSGGGTGTGNQWGILVAMLKAAVTAPVFQPIRPGPPHLPGPYQAGLLGFGVSIPAVPPASAPVSLTLSAQGTTAAAALVTAASLLTAAATDTTAASAILTAPALLTASAQATTAASAALTAAAQLTASAQATTAAAATLTAAAQLTLFAQATTAASATVVVPGVAFLTPSAQATTAASATLTAAALLTASAQATTAAAATLTAQANLTLSAQATTAATAQLQVGQQLTAAAQATTAASAALTAAAALTLFAQAKTAASAFVFTPSVGGHKVFYAGIFDDDDGYAVIG